MKNRDDPIASHHLTMAVSAYETAWISRDVNAIVALHSENSLFALHIRGMAPAIGRAAIRDQFQAILADNPTYAATQHNIEYGTDFVVIEYSFEGLETAGSSSSKVDALDLIYFEDGLVSVKHTYLDTSSLRVSGQPKEQPRC
jgi:hypothetical protein